MSDDFWFDGDDGVDDDEDLGQFYPSDYDPFDDSDDFYGDDITDDQLTIVRSVEGLTGKPPLQFVSNYDDIVSQGRAGQVRGVRFSSGAEALIWLYTRGIFLFSRLVKFSDGTWGVAIGSSDQTQQEHTESDLSIT